MSGLYKKFVPKNILVMRLGGIGELIAIIPALKKIREAFPEAKITLLAEKGPHRVLDGLNLYDKFVGLNFFFCANRIRDIFCFEFFQEIFYLIEFLIFRKYDMFLCFQHYYFWRSIYKPLVISIFSKCPVRVGFNSYNRPFFLNLKVKEERFGGKHLIYMNQDFLNTIGLELKNCNPVLNVDKKAEEYVEKILPAGIFIGVAPGAARASKCWPIENFITLCQRLLDKFASIKFVLIGRGREEKICQEIQKRFPQHSVNLANKTDLSQLFALIKKLKLLISNDTGVIHIAYALGTPVVALFGPGEFYIWGTYKERERFIGIYKAVDCSPCLKITCDDMKCMKLITVDEVFESAVMLLSRQGL